MRARLLRRLLPRVILASLATLVAADLWSCDQPPTEPSPVCSLSISPADQAFASAGGTASVSVTASAASCAWNAIAGASWITVLDGGSGTGSRTVTYSVAPNPSAEPRTAGLLIGSFIHTISQQGTLQVCSYVVTPVEFTPCMAGATLSTTIATQSSCPWTATPSVPWLSVTSGESGDGPASINFSFEDNYDAPREGLLLVRWPSPTAGQNVHVSQAGCRYGVSTTAIDFPSAGGFGRFDVVQQSDPYECGGPTQNKCVWTATSDAPWITITNGTPHTGDDPVFFVVAASAGARIGTIRVRDKAVQISQAAP